MDTPWYDRILAGLYWLTSRFRPWFRWPFLIALPTMLGHRVIMRQQNLFDTETAPPKLDPPDSHDVRGARMPDGSFNDLGQPWMGMAKARFGRNVPIPVTFGETAPGLYDPSPRLVSNKLLARQTFQPVPHLNVLVPAWLQFMVHDWLSHGSNDKDAPRHVIPLPPGDDWPGNEMVVLRTRPDRHRGPLDEDRPATYRNTETHWWDGSQIYGSGIRRQLDVRRDPATGEILPDGKVALDSRGHLLVDTSKRNLTPDLELAGVNGNWWLGLSAMTTLFAREHNVIVDRLRDDYPQADGEWLFQKARLVNAALLAKIHTTEWTPALMNSSEGRTALRANWWGILGEHYRRGYGRVGANDLLSGIPGSPFDHHSAPYAMTEEFTAVYRMHSLIPDEFSFRRPADDSEILRADLAGVAGSNPHRLWKQFGLADAFYSFGTSNPGAPVLHNFPQNLRRFDRSRDDGFVIDLASIDILRDRERGVPRYCEFRKYLEMKVPKTFAELTDNPTWQRELEEVYGSVEKVDLLAGTLAEGVPPGFGFSDTAFRIFILMASRRLKSDRFYTDDFRPEVYTPAGFAWVADNSLRTVLTRHLPELARHFGDVRNVFFPWARGGA